MFDVKGEAATFVIFFCRYGVAAWLFITCLFVANTVFNNLGYPLLAMLFNWGRATLGTVPFVMLGARWGGVEGAIVGIGVGAAIFGVVATALAFGVVARLANAVKSRLARFRRERQGGGTDMNLNDIIQAAQGGQGVDQPRRPVRPDAGANAGGGAGADAGVLDRAAESHRRPVEPSRHRRPSGERPASGLVHRRRPSAATANGGAALTRSLASRRSPRRSPPTRRGDRRRRQHNPADDAGALLDAARRPRPQPDPAGLWQRAWTIDQRGDDGGERAGQSGGLGGLISSSGRQPVWRRSVGPGRLRPRPGGPDSADRNAGVRRAGDGRRISRGSTASCSSLGGQRS